MKDSAITIKDLFCGAGDRSKMFYEIDQVIECIKQQLLFDDKMNKYHKLGYDHVGAGNSFMQFTGLTDKNGKEIYEGDILSKVQIHELGRNIQYFYVVIWSSSDTSFKCKQYVLDENKEGYYWIVKKDGYFDSLQMVNTYNNVVGNIHENKQLFQ